DHAFALFGVHGREQPLLNIDHDQGSASRIEANAVTHQSLPATGPTVYRRERTANSRRGPRAGRPRLGVASISTGQPQARRVRRWPGPGSDTEAPRPRAGAGPRPRRPGRRWYGPP